MAAKTARDCVLSMLSRVFSEEVFLRDIFEEETAALSGRDRAFAEKLTLGVLEKKTALDAVIAQVSTTPLKKLKPKILRILEIGGYELLFLSKASYALVNEAVSLTKRSGLAGLSGFVNAVLRRISREGQEIFNALDPWQKLGIPETLKNLLIQWYGDEKALSVTEAMCREDTRMVIRRCKRFCTEQEFTETLEKDGVQPVKTGLTADTYYADGESPVFHTEGFKRGFFYIQDLSSCMAAEAVSDLMPERILDVCSAPGGKLLQILDGLSDYTEAVACDLTEKRTKLIRENLARLPYLNVQVREADASIFSQEYENRFDLVIADLPCSGLGTLQKNPELRYRTTEKSLREIQALQKSILDTVCRYVQPKGTLLYSTCTLNPAENSLQISEFLRNHPEFTLQAFTDNLPECLKSREAGSGQIQILPDEFPGSGFYIARLYRKP
jgi:16S rRNA (cytosine967-C5)-methyltransferase